MFELLYIFKQQRFVYARILKGPLACLLKFVFLDLTDSSKLRADQNSRKSRKTTHSNNILTVRIWDSLVLERNKILSPAKQKK